jgi:DNA-binding MarR family transcriptional regulator
VSEEAQDHTGRILEEWQRESPELDMAPIAVIGRVLRAARYLERAVERELSHHLLFTSGGLTKLLERLERSGLISREPGPGDRRVVLVQLTEEGRVRQEAAMRAHLANEEALLADLSAADREALSGMLRSLLLGLEEDERRRRPPLRAIGRGTAS